MVICWYTVTSQTFEVVFFVRNLQRLALNAREIRSIPILNQRKRPIHHPLLVKSETHPEPSISSTLLSKGTVHDSSRKLFSSQFRIRRVRSQEADWCRIMPVINLQKLTPRLSCERQGPSTIDGQPERKASRGVKSEKNRHLRTNNPTKTPFQPDRVLPGHSDWVAAVVKFYRISCYIDLLWQYTNANITEKSTNTNTLIRLLLSMKSTMTGLTKRTHSTCHPSSETDWMNWWSKKNSMFRELTNCRLIGRGCWPIPDRRVEEVQKLFGLLSHVNIRI